MRPHLPSNIFTLLHVTKIFSVCVCVYQILLSLPCIAPQDLLAFEEALTKTTSPKEQKQHMRSLLILATGNKLKALAAQKSVNVITNVSSKLSDIASSSELYFLFHASLV